MLNKILYILGGLFLVGALVAVAGLGVWAYQSNVKLIATQKQLTSLQADYAKLKTGNGKLSTDLSQANSTLDQTRSDLARAQADLTKANSDKAAVQSKLNKVKALTAVGDVFISGKQEAVVKFKIEATGDSTLSDLWDTLVKSPSGKNFASFFEYLISAINAAAN